MRKTFTGILATALLPLALFFTSPIHAQDKNVYGPQLDSLKTEIESLWAGLYYIACRQDIETARTAAGDLSLTIQISSSQLLRYVDHSTYDRNLVESYVTLRDSWDKEYGVLSKNYKSLVTHMSYMSAKYDFSDGGKDTLETGIKSLNATLKTIDAGLRHFDIILGMYKKKSWGF